MDEENDENLPVFYSVFGTIEGKNHPSGTNGNPIINPPLFIVTNVTQAEGQVSLIVF
jgi:hypothetical protein